MPTSPSDPVGARAVDIKVTDEELTVPLEDGRTLAVPLVWYPGFCTRRSVNALVGG